MSWSAGIDLGGTTLKAAAVSESGAIMHRVSAHSTTGGTGDWTTPVLDAIAACKDKMGSPPRHVGVCAPGLPAADSRSIAHLPVRLPGLQGLDWAAALGRTGHVPVLNDANAALLGEAWTGAARGKRHVVMLTLGTGVGGSVLVDGFLLRGATGRAGHLGHACLQPGGEASILGMPGALEVFFGDYTIPQRTRGRFASTRELVAAHVAGNAEASEIWIRSVEALGAALGSFSNIFDPELIVLAGGITLCGNALLEPLRAAVARCEWKPSGGPTPIVLSALGEWAGALGAARAAAFPETLDHPASQRHGSEA